MVSNLVSRALSLTSGAGGKRPGDEVVWMVTDDIRQLAGGQTWRRLKRITISPRSRHLP